MHNVTQLVHLCAVTLLDHAAILQCGRRFLFQRCKNPVPDILQRIDLLRKCIQLRTAAAGSQFPDQGQLGAGAGQRVNFLGGGGAVHRAGHQTLHIEHMGKCLAQLGPLDVFAVKGLHTVEPAIDGRRAHQRLLQPAAQKALAHGSLGFVQHPEKSAPFLAAAHGLGQLQIGTGNRGKLHVLGFGVAVHQLQPLHTLFLGAVQVTQQRAQRRVGIALPAKAGGLGPVRAKLLGQQTLHLIRGVALILHQLHRAGHVLLDVGGHVLKIQKRRVEQQLAGIVAAQLCNQLGGEFFPRQLGGVGAAGGNVRKADADAPIL